MSRIIVVNSQWSIFNYANDTSPPIGGLVILRNILFLQRAHVAFGQSLSPGFQDAAHDLAGTRLW